MISDLYPVLPVVALGLFLAAIAAPVFLPRLADRPGRLWPLPLVASVLFLLWTLHALAEGGLGGVWAEHVRNAWGNQVWFDLLMAVGLAWVLLLPRIKRAGMRPLPWLLAVAATGCIGLYLMLARCLYLESRRSDAA